MRLAEQSASDEMGRLDGRRIVVTRSADRSAELIGILQTEGADVVELPLIETVDASDGGRALREAMAHLDEYDWLVVTSPEGARRVLAASGNTTEDGHLPVPVKIAAVGRATAATFGRVDLVPDVHTGAALGAAFPPGPGRVLFAAARDAGPDFESAVRAKGWNVHRITAYETRSVAVDARWSREVVTADAVIFASGSAVRSWVQSLGGSVPRLVVAMGPTTARVLAESGIAPVTVAGEQTVTGLVEAVIDALGAT